MECLCRDEQCPVTQLEFPKDSGEGDQSEAQTRKHFADVGVAISLRICVECGSKWLHCAIDDSANAGWNRWYRCPAPESLGKWSFESASEALMDSDWHFYGGPFYRCSGERAFGPVPIKEVLAPPPPVIEETEPERVSDESVLWTGMGAVA